ncbi:MAG: helix-turn-helix transcriptional regulator, partial [Nitriliruptoraceae bacterium]
LAALAGTAQSAVAAYEAGGREPTVPVLARMVAATGHRLVLDAVPDPALYRLADVALDIAATDPADGERRLRFVFEFLRGAVDDGHPLALLVSAEPPLTGDDRFDALLAAVGEDLCVREGEIPPSWVHGPGRFLDRAWWVSELPSARASALVHAPASFRRRGVMLDRHDLEAA